MTLENGDVVRHIYGFHKTMYNQNYMQLFMFFMVYIVFVVGSC